MSFRIQPGSRQRNTSPCKQNEKANLRCKVELISSGNFVNVQNMKLKFLPFLVHLIYLFLFFIFFLHQLKTRDNGNPLFPCTQVTAFQFSNLGRGALTESTFNCFLFFIRDKSPFCKQFFVERMDEEKIDSICAPYTGA